MTHVKIKLMFLITKKLDNTQQQYLWC